METTIIIIIIISFKALHSWDYVENYTSGLEQWVSKTLQSTSNEDHQVEWERLLSTLLLLVRMDITELNGQIV